MEKSNSEELSGSLHVRTTIHGKKGSKKQNWCVLNKRTNQVECYKHEKDVSTHKPIDQLQLYGAGVSFGNNAEHEFIINIRGIEYCMNAENHKTLMKWVNVLQKQVKQKPAVTGSPGNAEAILESLPEDEPLQIKRNTQDKKSKRKSIFHRLFSRKFRSKKDYSTANNHVMDDDEQRTVKPAPLRSVVGSMQDITDKKVSCNECNLMQGRNIYLNEQVQKLNEDVENIKDQLRTHVRKYGTLELEHIYMKKQLVDTILTALTDEDDLYKSIAHVPFNESIIDLLKKEREMDEGNRLPVITDGKMQIHEDHFGFIHGKRESPLQLVFYLCQVLKRNYTELLQISQNTYQQWQTVVSSIKSRSLLQPDETLKNLSEKGIPHEFRSSVWKMLVENHVESIRKEKGNKYYENLVAQLPDPDEEEEADGSIEKQIKIDLLRTFPTHKEYQEFDEGKVPVLHRILRAYLLHNPEISYCQGMNFMVAFAMLYLEEETCFWLLVAVTEVMFCKTHYNLYLSGTQANQKVLQALCQQTMPDMMKHLENLMCELSPVTFNWFMTIFIDSLPVDMVLQVWDIFLVFGHPILYKVALSLLKIHKKTVMKSKDALTAMKKLKKLGKTYYDSEQLMEDVFSSPDILSDEKLVELYHEYLDEIEEESNKRKLEDEEYEKRRQKLKFTPKQMMVSISDNLDALEDDMIIKCAECDANRNFVWLCCTSDLMGQIFILNVANRNIDPINWQVPCKCLAMCRFARSNLMLVSTIKSTLHAIDVGKKTEVWKLQLAGTALSINCDPSGNVILTLMDGTVAFLYINTKEHQTQPTYVDISRSPVMCGLIVDDMFWCGAGNKILVLDIKTLETSRSMRICPVERHSVSHLVESSKGVWSCVEGSSVVHMWHKTKNIPLLTVDILVEGGLSSEKKTGSLLSTGITTAIVLKEKLWVGFGNGRFIISDIVRETGNTDDDLNDAFNFYKSSMDNLDKIESPTKQKDNTPKLGVTTCCHALVGEDLDDTKNSPRLKQYVDDATDFVMVDKRVSAALENNEEYKLKMNQIQRVSEHPVNCFVPCRNDQKLILTCMGALNDDSSVILWSSEKREGREMWFAQTVSYSE